MATLLTRLSLDTTRCPTPIGHIQEHAEVSSRSHYGERLHKAREVTKHGDTGQIVELLDWPEQSVRAHALFVIRRRRLASAAPALIRRLELEKDDDLRARTMGVLKTFALPDAREAFLAGLDDPSPDVQRQAVVGLGAIHDARAISAAEDRYHTGDKWMKYATIGVLVELGGEDSRAALERLLEAESKWWWRRRIRKAVRSTQSGPN